MSIFHRYKSTIHGNYRKAYLRCGLLTGGLLALYLLVRLLMGKPAESPVSLLTDAILLVAVFLLMAHYRNILPDKKISLKEAMLFGVGLSAVAALVYAAALWCICMASPTQLAQFPQTAPPDGQSWPALYWATWWSLYSAVLLALLGSFGSFVAAILFRNEKSEVVHRDKTHQKSDDK